MPQLEQLIESVFGEADPSKLRGEVDKLIAHFQHPEMQLFAGWAMPEQTVRFQAGKDDLIW